MNTLSLTWVLKETTQFILGYWNPELITAVYHKYDGLHLSVDWEQNFFITTTNMDIVLVANRKS